MTTTTTRSKLAGVIAALIASAVATAALAATSRSAPDSAVPTGAVATQPVDPEQRVHGSATSQAQKAPGPRPLRLAPGSGVRREERRVNGRYGSAEMPPGESRADGNLETESPTDSPARNGGGDRNPEDELRKLKGNDP